MNIRIAIAMIVAKLRSMFTTKKTVTSIIASLNKTVDNLTETAQRSRDEAMALYTKADQLEDAANALVDEAGHAGRVAARVRQLLA